MLIRNVEYVVCHTDCSAAVADADDDHVTQASNVIEAENFLYSVNFFYTFWHWCVQDFAAGV